MIFAGFSLKGKTQLFYHDLNVEILYNIKNP